MSDTDKLPGVIWIDPWDARRREESGTWVLNQDDPDDPYTIPYVPQKELDEARAALRNKAAEKMPHSFVEMKYACGHTWTRRQRDELKAEVEQLSGDAEKYRALQAQCPQDGSKGQMDAWAELQRRVQRAEKELEEANSKRIDAELNAGELQECVDELQECVDELKAQVERLEIKAACWTSFVEMCEQYGFVGPYPGGIVRWAQDRICAPSPVVKDLQAQVERLEGEAESNRVGFKDAVSEIERLEGEVERLSAPLPVVQRPPMTIEDNTPPEDASDG